MKRILTPISMVVVMALLAAPAGAGDAPATPEQNSGALELKDCKVIPPKGMKLAKIDVCTVTAGGDYIGHFFFEGEETVTGDVSYEYFDDEILGGNILGFRSDNFKEYRPYSSAGEAFNFEDYDRTIPKLHPPNITKTKDKCWVARATLKVRAIEVVNGGSDQDGTWATDFDVLQIGKYKRCKRGEDGKLNVLDRE